ncbi:MAG: Multidrug export protein EmrB [Chlamydiae bacterium]|nr:Multidrug export protein EmrB [Chlamydiota bacterium]
MVETKKGIEFAFLSLAIGLAAFMVSLDGFIVNVAIPTISGGLGIRDDLGTWIITLFTMSSTLFVPLTGWLAQRIGSIHLFGIATLWFSLFSFLCGIAHNFPLLLFFRVLQGAAAGLLIPLTLSLILATFPQNKKSIAIGFWSFFVMVAPAMGPMVGGWFSNYHWAWLFYVSVPIGLFCGITVVVLLWGHKEEKIHLPLDWVGMSLIFLGLGTLQVALNRGQLHDWFRSPFITTLFLISFLSLTFFFIWEVFQKNPFLEIYRFRKWNFSLATLFMGTAMGVLFSSFILDSLWVQSTLGYTPAWAGYTLTPVGVFPLLMYPIMGKIVGKLDRRIWMSVSFALYACTFFWLSHINLHSPFWQLALPRLVQGIGFAMFTIPISLIVIEGVAPERMNFVVGLFSFARMMFVALSIPLVTTLWIHRRAFYRSRIMEQTFAENPVFTDLLARFRTLPISEKQLDGLTTDLIVSQANCLGLADIYYLFGWIFVALVAGVFLLKPKSRATV